LDLITRVQGEEDKVGADLKCDETVGDDCSYEKMATANVNLKYDESKNAAQLAISATALFLTAFNFAF